MSIAKDTEAAPDWNRMRVEWNGLDLTGEVQKTTYVIPEVDFGTYESRRPRFAALRERIALWLAPWL